MGRNCWSNRYMVEDCRALYIYQPEFRKRLADWHEDSNFELVLYENGQATNRQSLYLAKIKPYFGGSKHYFKCPKCFGRVTKLYLPPNTNEYACCHCHNLTYRSQKRRNGFQERFLMQFTRSRKLAWELYESLRK